MDSGKRIMKKVKYHLKILFGNNLNLMIFLISYAFFFWRLILQAVNLHQNWPDVMGGLVVRTSELSYLHFPVMFLLSMNFFREAKRSSFAEVLDAVNRDKRERQQFWLLMAVNVVITVLTALLNTVSYFTQRLRLTKYYFLLLAHVFADIFLVGVLAVVLGILLSVIQKRAVRLILFVALNFILGYPFSWVCYNFDIIWDPGKPADFLMEAVGVLPDGYQAGTDGYGGYAVQPHRIALLLLWIGIAVFLLVLIRNRKYKRFKLQAVAYAVVLAALLWIVCQPYTAIGSADSRFHYKYIAKATEYDTGIGRRDEPAEFQALSYDMELDAYLNLKAKVKITVDRDDLTEYRFTLYREYQADMVEDQDGKRLAFEQDGDYLTVFSGGNRISELTISYSGSGEPFYSEISGICLPTGVPFYPMAGFIPIYGENEYANGDYYNEIHLPQTHFKVKVNTLGKVYSSLPDVGKNTFEGDGEGFFLLSGLVFESEYRGTTFYYHENSSLAAAEDKEDHEAEFIDKMNRIYEEYGIDSLEGKTVLVNWQSMLSDIMQIYPDHIVIADTLLDSNMEKVWKDYLEHYTKMRREGDGADAYH